MSDVYNKRRRVVGRNNNSKGRRKLQKRTDHKHIHTTNDGEYVTLCRLSLRKLSTTNIEGEQSLNVQPDVPFMELFLPLARICNWPFLVRTPSTCSRVINLDGETGCEVGLAEYVRNGALCPRIGLRPRYCVARFLRHLDPRLIVLEMLQACRICKRHLRVLEQTIEAISCFRGIALNGVVSDDRSLRVH